jgi:hypothetical protein
LCLTDRTQGNSHKSDQAFADLRRQLHQHPRHLLDHLAHARESLASANVMANDLVDHLQGTSRHALLGIAQVIMLGELAVNRALDRLDPP